MARKKKPQRKERKGRASWSGMLRFGLVTFPVDAFNAHVKEAGGLAFHQLHAECHSRIRYQKVCPLHGPVEKEDIVSGYQFAKDQYVEIEPEELDELRTERERTLTIDNFIAPDELDPIYLDGRAYFLAPDGESAREAYAVFLEALRRQDRYGVGQVVFSSREQAVLVRPYHDGLLMSMLNYVAEIGEPAEPVGKLPSLRGEQKKIALAEQLIEGWSEEEFDFSTYTDRYVEKVKELVEAKVEGREIVAPEADEEPQVINLMEALRKSMAQKKKATHRAAATNGRARASHGRRRKVS